MRSVAIASLADVSLDVSVPNADALTVRPGGRFVIPVVLTNLGPDALSWSQQHALHFAYRWLDQDGRMIERDGSRSTIAVDALRPGTPIAVDVMGTSPEHEGAYRLQLSLVLEGVHWACDIGAAGWIERAVQALPAPAWPSDLRGSAGGRALRGAMAAANLARQIDGRTLAVGAARIDEVIAADTVATPAMEPPSIERSPRRPVHLRFRGWLRRALGVRGVELQLQDVLAQAARQEQHVRELVLSLTDTVRRDVEAPVLALADAARREVDTASDRARQLGDDLAEARHALSETRELVIETRDELSETRNAAMTYLQSIEQGIELQLQDVLAQAARQEQHVRKLVLSLADTVRRDVEAQVLALADAARREVDTASDRARQLGDDLAEARHALSDTRKLVIETRDELSEMRSELSETGNQVIATRNQVIPTRNQVDETREAVSEARNLLSETRDAVMTHLQSIEQASLAQSEQAAQAFAASNRALARLETAGEARRGLIADAHAKLDALDAAQQDATRELREGAVVVELITDMRQLVAWAQASGDLSIIAEVGATLRQLVEQMGERAWRDGAQRELLDVQVVGNSLKIDALLTRQTIPLAAAGVILVRNRFGLLAIQDNDAPAIAYYSSGDLPEPATVAIVERLLKPGDCFLDVGANVGIYSLIAGRRVGPKGKVVAIEPTPSTIRALRTTLAINGIADVGEAHECALGAAEGSATLYAEATSGHNSLLGPTGGTRASHQVAVKRGDAILGGLKPALIKIDVEGWELDVLEGLAPVIKTNKRLSAIVEFSADHVRRRGLAPDEWLDRLKTFGWNMWIIDDRHISLRSFEQASELDDHGANLFLSRALPAALKSMLHAR